MQMIMWNVDSNDWQLHWQDHSSWDSNPTLQTIQTTLAELPTTQSSLGWAAEEMGTGPIILQHDLYESAVQGQRAIIRYLRAAGYRFVNMDKCLSGTGSRFPRKNRGDVMKNGKLPSIMPTIPRILPNKKPIGKYPHQRVNTTKKTFNRRTPRSYRIKNDKKDEDDTNADRSIVEGDDDITGEEIVIRGKENQKKSMVVLEEEHHLL